MSVSDRCFLGIRTSGRRERWVGCKIRAAQKVVKGMEASPKGQLLLTRFVDFGWCVAKKVNISARMFVHSCMWSHFKHFYLLVRVFDDVVARDWKPFKLSRLPILALVKHLTSFGLSVAKMVWMARSNCIPVDTFVSHPEKTSMHSYKSIDIQAASLLRVFFSNGTPSLS